MGKKQRKRELKRLWRYLNSLNAYFESAVDQCEDLLGMLQKVHADGACSRWGPGISSGNVVKLGDDVQQSDNAPQPEEPICVFSGNSSRKMWDAINNSRTKHDLREALYLVCCRVQDFENLNEHDHQRMQVEVDDLSNEIGDVTYENREARENIAERFNHIENDLAAVVNSQAAVIDGFDTRLAALTRGIDNG